MVAILSSETPSVGPKTGYLLLLLGVIGAAHAVWVCGSTLWAAGSPFWAHPPGDIATGLIGAEAYLLDSWRWPIAATARLVSDGRPVSIAYTDSLPLLMIVLKALGPMTASLPPFGVAILAGQILQPVAAGWALRRAGLSHWAILLPGALLIAWAPAWYFRLGAQHLPLTWHWEILLALGLAVGWCRTGRIGPSGWIGAILLCAASVGTHVYFGVQVLAICMVGVVVLAMAREYVAALGFGASLVAAVAVAAFAVGLLPPPDSGVSMGRSASTPGHYSFNVFAPFDFSYSTLWPTAHRIDATGGQYEGMAYLGIGILLALGGSLLALVWSLRRDASGSAPVAAAGTVSFSPRRYWPLLVVLLGFVGFAMFPTVWLGTHKLVSLPLPPWLSGFLEHVRSGGRMIWPAVYAFAIILVVIVGGRVGSRLAGPFLVAALIVQIVDTATLRERTRMMLATPPLVPAGLSALRAAGVLDRDVRLRPSWLCVRLEDGDVGRLTALEVIRHGRTVHQPPMARGASGDCDTSRISTDPPPPGVVDLIFMGSVPLQDQLAIYARRKCSVVSTVLVCEGMRSPGPLSTEDAQAALAPPTNAAFGTRLPVTAGEPAAKWLTSGWSNPEHWATWSEGGTAILHVPIPKEGSPQAIALEVTAYSGNPSKMQSVAVTVGGKTKWQGRLAPGHVSTIRIPIDPSDIVSSFVPLTLHIDNPQSPKSNGQGPDSRLLGVALQAIVLEGSR